MHLRMADLIPAMEKALIDFSMGKVIQPVRQVIAVDPPGGFYGMMPALTPEGLGQAANLRDSLENVQARRLRASWQDEVP